MIEIKSVLPTLSGYILSGLRQYPIRRYLTALLLTVPALVAILILQSDLPFSTILFVGGPSVFRANLSLAVLFPYFGLFMLALGKLLLPTLPRSERSPLSLVDVEVIYFFGGAGILGILGFGLGLANLLIPWVTIPIFCTMLYGYFLRTPDFAQRFLAWITMRNLDRPGDSIIYSLSFYIAGLLRVLILALISYLLLAKGVLLDIYYGDVQHAYFPYFADVRQLHDIWLDPMNPTPIYFITFHGYGVHLFLTNIANQFALQIVTIVYLVSIALLVRQMVRQIIPKDTPAPIWSVVCHIFPDSAMLLILASPFLVMESGRLHSQDGAFMLFLGWSTLYFLILSREQTTWLFRMLLPVAIALPLSLPQSQAFIVPILAIGTVILFFRRGKLWAGYNIILMAVGVVVMGGTLLFNHYYIGIPAVNPTRLFLPVVNLQRFQQWGIGIDQLYHLSALQDHGMSFWQYIYGNFSTIMEQLSFSGHIQNLIGYLIFGLFFWLIFYYRTYSYLVWMFIGALGLAIFRIGAGSVKLLTWGPRIDWLLTWVGVLPDSIIYQTVNVFIVLFYLFVCLYLVFFLVLGVRLRISGRNIKPNTLIFSMLFLLSYSIGWLLIFMVQAEVVKRVLWFQDLYPSIFLLTGVILGIILLEQTNANGGREIQGARRDFLPLIVSSSLCAYFVAGTARALFELSGIQYYALVITFPIAWLAGVRYIKWVRTRGQDIPTTLDPGIAALGPIVPIAIGLVSIYLAVVHGFLPYYNNHSFYLGGPPILKATQYFFGVEPLNTSMPQRVFDRCQQLAEIVPEGDSILALNSNLKIVPDCYSLLPNGKIVDTYHTALGPHYREILLGNSQDAYTIYKDLGINYFYVEKEDILFWGPGWSESFSVENLLNNFEVFWEDEDFYILTWRGAGIRPLSESEASYIDKLRENAITIWPTWRGLDGLQAWLGAGETGRFRPILVEEDYKGFNIIVYRGKFYGLSQTIDLTDLNLSRMNEYQALCVQIPQCEIADSLEEARQRLDQLTP